MARNSALRLLDRVFEFLHLLLLGLLGGGNVPDVAGDEVLVGRLLDEVPGELRDVFLAERFDRRVGEQRPGEGTVLAARRGL